MIYLAFFNFREDGSKPRSGHLSCLVEATNPGEATDKLKRLISDYREAGDGFDGVSKVYVSRMIAFNKLPSEGIIARISSEDTMPISSEIFATLPFPSAHECAVYEASTFDSDSNTTDDDTPFIVFERQTK